VALAAAGARRAALHAQTLCSPYARHDYWAPRLILHRPDQPALRKPTPASDLSECEKPLRAVRGQLAAGSVPRAWRPPRRA
jgi:hypothetical protein